MALFGSQLKAGRSETEVLMACCGRTADRVSGKAGLPGCILCKIWLILTREKTPEGDPCVVVPGRVIRKPDPCIYDQFLLMQLNQPVTWDNPDVRLFLGGVEQYTYNLTVSTEYDVTIEVHNSSRDARADGTMVDVRWIEFGAGGQTRHPIATLSANVPVWPAGEMAHPRCAWPLLYRSRAVAPQRWQPVEQSRLE